VLDFTGGIVVGCGDGSVILTEVQPEGKRRMSAKDYLLGNKIKVGDLLI
ncbi:MAG: methionyl-tRNA formyltransferase, partial [Clostridia bacterium]|nr:methionyl-tRNA formyltransferase [Clostridia bacterium]